MTEFIRQGHFQRHLNRMRNIYKSKRDYILKVLEPYSPQIQISGENSGLHLLIRFKDGRSEEELLAQAEKNRLHLFGISQYMTQMPVPKHLTSTIILGYASLTFRQLQQGMEHFIQCYF